MDTGFRRYDRKMNRVFGFGCGGAALCRSWWEMFGAQAHPTSNISLRPLHAFAVKKSLRPFDWQWLVDRVAANRVHRHNRLMGGNRAFLRVDGFPFAVFNFFNSEMSARWPTFSVPRSPDRPKSLAAFAVAISTTWLRENPRAINFAIVVGRS